MARTRTTGRNDERQPLTRERVLRAAIEVADASGIEALTMRRLGQELGVEAMSIYNHVEGKDAVLDGMTDLVLGDIEVPSSGVGWREAMRQRAVSAHEVLLAHPWAAILVTSRFNIGPGMTRHLEATFGRLLEGGFSVAGALDAWNVLDSHLYGFTLQELNLPFDVSETQQVSTDVLAHLSADEFPHVVRVISEIMRTGRTEDFELGLDLVLDGLERRLGNG